jgi:hypothetical protein
MTQRQFDAWNAWIASEQPTRPELYLAQLAQYLDAILHMFDKSFKAKELDKYTLGAVERVKAPEKRPGRVPVVDGEWWPHPLTKEEAEAAKASVRRAQVLMKTMDVRRK